MIPCAAQGLGFGGGGSAGSGGDWRPRGGLGSGAAGGSAAGGGVGGGGGGSSFFANTFVKSSTTFTAEQTKRPVAAVQGLAGYGSDDEDEGYGAQAAKRQRQQRASRWASSTDSDRYKDEVLHR